MLMLRLFWWCLFKNRVVGSRCLLSVIFPDRERKNDILGISRWVGWDWSDTLFGSLFAWGDPFSLAEEASGPIKAWDHMYVTNEGIGQIDYVNIFLFSSPFCKGEGQIILNVYFGLQWELFKISTLSLFQVFNTCMPPFSAIYFIVFHRYGDWQKQPCRQHFGISLCQGLGHVLYSQRCWYWFLIFFSFLAVSMAWEVPGPRIEPMRSSDLSSSRDNPGSLIH